MSNLFESFEEAATNDDISKISSLSRNSELSGLDQGSRSSLLMYSFRTACERGSRRVANEMIRRWPDLSRFQNEDGLTAMHIVSANGDVELVEHLGKLNHRSCLVEDNSSMIPLHVAAVRGHAEVIRELIGLHPESLAKLTSRQETALHLAVKNSRCGALQVLVDETKNREHNLLDMEDDEGHTALHIARVKELNDIVEILLSGSSQVMNENGLGALDVSHEQSMASLEISHPIHNEDGARDQKGCPGQQSANLFGIWSFGDIMVLPLEIRNVLLMVLTMIAGAAFTVTYSLPDALLRRVYPAGVTLHAMDVMYGRLPSVFYVMVFNSAGFMAATVMIAVLLSRLPLRTVFFFVLVCAFIVYVILVNDITPKFSVRVGNSTISSITLVWTLAIAFICAGITILGFGKYILMCFCRFIHWFWSKRTSY